VVLLTAAGEKEESRRNRHTFPALAPILACLILGYPTITTGRALVQPRMHEEIRPLLVHLRQHYREGDVVYVYPAAQYASQYYARRGLSLPGSVIVGVTKDEIDVGNLRGHARVWVLFSHVAVSDGMNEERHFVRLLDSAGARLDERLETGASLYLYDLSQSARGGAH